MRPSRYLIFIALLLLTMLLISACSQNHNPNSNDTWAGVENDQEERLIAYLPSGMTSPFYSQAAQSAEQYGKKFGLELEAQAPPAETDFNGQMAIFENFIDRKVDGILFCAIDSKVLAPSIKKANAAEIPLIVFNSLTPQQGGEITGYVGYNQYKAGYTVGEYAGKILKGQGNVFVIRGVPGFHDTLRTNGFYDALKNFPKIKVLGEQIGDWVRDKSIQIAADALETYPNIDLILGVNDEMAIGATIAAKKVKREIYTIGIDGNPISMEEIEKGNLTATLAAFPDKIGETAMEQMRKVLAGEIIPQFLETPGVLVDKSNIEAYKAGSLWTEPKVSKPEVINES